MKEIEVPSRDLFNDETQEFINIPGCKLQLEHSLVSISKWESKWHKPFMTNNEKSYEEIIDYIKCMTINRNVDDNVYYNLTPDNIEEINNYIKDPMTATTFNERKTHTTNREIITSELVYYWMFQFNISLECEKWHINRLLTLIKVCNIKNDTSNNKMSKKDIMSRNAALNAARRKQLNTKG